jgi:hypothetical protein
MSAKSSMMPDDIIETLEYNDILEYDEEAEKYILELDMSVIPEYLEKHKEKGYITVDPDNLRWTPLMH